MDPASAALLRNAKLNGTAAGIRGWLNLWQARVVIYKRDLAEHARFIDIMQTLNSAPITSNVPGAIFLREHVNMTSLVNWLDTQLSTLESRLVEYQRRGEDNSQKVMVMQAFAKRVQSAYERTMDSKLARLEQEIGSFDGDLDRFLGQVSGNSTQSGGINLHDDVD